MRNQTMRRLLGGAAIIGLALAVAGCARNSAGPPATAYPPPAASGSTAQPQWFNPAAQKPGAGYAVTSPLHLRAGPGVNNSVIGTLPAGTQVEATGSQQGGWWEVQTPDGTGWVSSHYLSPT